LGEFPCTLWLFSINTHALLKQINQRKKNREKNTEREEEEEEEKENWSRGAAEL